VGRGGVVAGSFLSPLLGALYLAPLDRAMEQRVAQAAWCPICVIWTIEA
jgi:hypothetical protein